MLFLFGFIFFNESLTQDLKDSQSNRFCLIILSSSMGLANETAVANVLTNERNVDPRDAAPAPWYKDSTTRGN